MADVGFGLVIPNGESSGVADRRGALEGSLEVTSAIGSGATVTGRLPVGSRERMVTP